jgi:hypothetical protein
VRDPAALGARNPDRLLTRPTRRLYFPHVPGKYRGGGTTLTRYDPRPELIAGIRWPKRRRGGWHQTQTGDDPLAAVAGYSRLVAEDEERTLQIFRGHKEVFGKLVKPHRGRIFNTAGDALLAEFAV